MRRVEKIGVRSAGRSPEAGRRPVRRGLASSALFVMAVLAAPSVSAQTPTMPSTLRYGSGLIDIPVSSVLSRAQITATVSGFFVDLGRRAEIDDTGATVSYGPGVDRFYKDASVAFGLFDRAEAGFTFQSFADEAQGGNIWGLFGRLRLWEPIDQGLGFAVGGRYLTSPSFGDGTGYQPGRLGFADERIREDYDGIRGASTNLSLYAVATAFLRGFDAGWLPENDITLTAGLGNGMLSGPGELDFYSDGQTNGWFVGSAFHVAVSPRSVLTVMAEHNGFDVNLGAHYDFDGFRVGLQYLASNHAWPTDGHTSEYEKPKIGLMGSVAICLDRPRLRCTPTRMARVEPDTIFIPPPPPDTVVIDAVVSPPPGTDEALCLSTGQSIPIRLTSDGDTLIAPSWTSIRAVRPSLTFAGSYAAEAFWYRAGQLARFEGAEYMASPDTFPLSCAEVARVGFFEGVPLFASLNARRPLDVVFVPVRPGIWHRYERIR